MRTAPARATRIFVGVHVRNFPVLFADEDCCGSLHCQEKILSILTTGTSSWRPYVHGYQTFFCQLLLATVESTTIAACSYKKRSISSNTNCDRLFLSACRLMWRFIPTSIGRKNTACRQKQSESCSPPFATLFVLQWHLWINRLARVFSRCDELAGAFVRVG